MKENTEDEAAEASNGAAAVTDAESECGDESVGTPSDAFIPTPFVTP